MLRVKSAGIIAVTVLLLAGFGCRSVPTVTDEGDRVSARQADQPTDGPRNLKVQPGPLKMRAPRPMMGEVSTDATARAPRPDTDAAAVDAEPIRAGSGVAYYLESGDPIIITLRGPGQSGAVEDVVDERGNIKLPFIGEVTAAGLSSSQLESKIHDMYVPDYYRYMTVSVLVPSQRSYYVTGYVNGPGRYPYLADMTLLKALGAAAGPTNYADVKKIKISRGDQTLGPYNLREIEKDPSKDVSIEPGDIIKVPKSWI
jgi:polysaccharide export outer membrane protein